MAKIVLSKVSKTYKNGLNAVKDLNLTIEDGEFVVLVGPSGCGKTTTLRMIAGLEDVTAGSIYIDGLIVNNTLPKDRNVAMVFQNYTLFPYMNVYNNIVFGLKVKRVPKPEVEKKVSEVSKLLNIEHLLNRRPKELSGGEKQRVALGRAIVREPRLFLFDEPLSNLDANLRTNLRNEIAKIHKVIKTTTIYVTHDQVEAMTLGQRIVVMKDGLVEQIGKPLDVYNRPNSLFVAKFTGTMNTIQGSFVRKGDDLCFTTKTGTVLFYFRKIDSQQKQELSRIVDIQVVLGFRPEHIKLTCNAAISEHSVTCLDATCYAVENRGDRSYAILSIDKLDSESLLTAGLDVGERLVPEERVKLLLDIDKVHQFDFVTGNRL